MTKKGDEVRGPPRSVLDPLVQARCFGSGMMKRGRVEEVEEDRDKSWRLAVCE